jgi:hypothetical protein
MSLVDDLPTCGSTPAATTIGESAELRRHGAAATPARALHKEAPVINQVSRSTPMYAINTASFDTSFQTIAASQLTDISGGFDFGSMVNAGNANVASGATAGAALGGTGGAIAGGIAGGTVAGAPTMGLGTVGGVLAGAAAGGTAGTAAGGAIGGGVGWIGGAAGNAWSQLTRR